MGGAMALRLGLESPQEFKGLLLIAPAIKASENLYPVLRKLVRWDQRDACPHLKICCLYCPNCGCWISSFSSRTKLPGQKHRWVSSSFLESLSIRHLDQAWSLDLPWWNQSNDWTAVPWGTLEVVQANFRRLSIICLQTWKMLLCHSWSCTGKKTVS
jgi:hypothetical protein